MLGESIVNKVLALTVCCRGGGAARRIFECGAAEDDEMWVPGLMTKATDTKRLIRFLTASLTAYQAPQHQDSQAGLGRGACIENTQPLVMTKSGSRLGQQ